MENKTNKSNGGIIFGIVFILWFFTSMGGLLYCSNKGLETLSAGIFGQYFLVFGILALVSGIKSKNFNPIMLLFPLKMCIRDRFNIFPLFLPLKIFARL